MAKPDAVVIISANYQPAMKALAEFGAEFTQEMQKLSKQWKTIAPPTEVFKKIYEQAQAILKIMRDLTKGFDKYGPAILKVAKANETFNKSQRKTTSVAKIVEKDAKRVINQFQRQKAVVDVLAAGYKTLTHWTSRVMRTTQRLGKGVNMVGKGFGVLWRGITRGFKALRSLQSFFLRVVLIGYTLFRAVKSLYDPWAELQSAIIRTSAIMGGSIKIQETLKQRVLELAASSVFAAKEIAEASYWMASAGLKQKEIFQALGPVIAFATVHQESLAATSETAIGVMKTYNLTASDLTHIVGVMDYAISRTALTMQRFSEAMVYIGPLAYSLGITFEEVTASLMVLHDKMIKGAKAGTFLRRMLAGVIKMLRASGEEMDLGEFMATKLRITHEQLADIFNKEGPEILKLLDLHKLLKDATDALTKSEQAEAFLLMGRIRALSGLAAWLSISTEKMKKHVDAMKDINELEKKLTTVTDSAWASFKMLGSVIDWVRITLMETFAPALQEISDFIIANRKVILKWAKDIGEKIKTWILPGFLMLYKTISMTWKALTYLGKRFKVVTEEGLLNAEVIHDLITAFGYFLEVLVAIAEPFARIAIVLFPLLIKAIKGALSILKVFGSKLIWFFISSKIVFWLTRMGLSFVKIGKAIYDAWKAGTLLTLTLSLAKKGLWGIVEAGAKLAAIIGFAYTLESVFNALTPAFDNLAQEFDTDVSEMEDAWTRFQDTLGKTRMPEPIKDLPKPIDEVRKRFSKIAEVVSINEKEAQHLLETLTEIPKTAQEELWRRWDIEKSYKIVGKQIESSAGWLKEMLEGSKRLAENRGREVIHGEHVYAAHQLLKKITLEQINNYAKEYKEIQGLEKILSMLPIETEKQLRIAEELRGRIKVMKEDWKALLGEIEKVSPLLKEKLEKAFKLKAPIAKIDVGGTVKLETMVELKPTSKETAEAVGDEVEKRVKPRIDEITEEITLALTERIPDMFEKSTIALG